MNAVTETKVTSISETGVSRDGILGLQAAVIKAIDAGALADVTAEQEVEHAFIPGAYARSLLIKEGALIIGKIHRYPCFNFILRGRITVWSEEGIKEIVAPFFFVSQPGIKRVGYAHEETLWFNVHGTTETDLEVIEAQLIAKTFDDLLIPESFMQFIKGNA